MVILLYVQSNLTLYLCLDSTRACIRSLCADNYNKYSKQIQTVYQWSWITIIISFLMHSCPAWWQWHQLLLREFGVDSATLARWPQVRSRMDRLLQCVEKLTIYIYKEECITSTTDTVRQLHLPMVRELCLERHPHIYSGTVEVYPSLCDTILQSFPAHLNKVTSQISGLVTQMLHWF